VNVLDGLQLGFGRRLPIVLQTEAAECGLACISMVAAYYGYHTESTDLRRRFGLSLKGATLKDMMRIADQIGLAARPLRLEVDELALLKMPCILHWNLNHFVVLKSATQSSVVIHDPGYGLRRMSLQQASRHFTGIALELMPTSRFEPAAAPPRVSMRALLGHLVGVKRSLVQLMSLALAIEVFAMVAPLFLVWVVDHALVTSDQDLLLTLVLGFSLLIVLQTLISALRGWVVIALGASMKVQARTNLFSHLLNLPAGYFESRYIADIMSRFGSQETILQAITTDAVIAIMDGLMCCVTLTLMFVFAPTLTVVVISGAIIYALLRWASYTRLRQASMEAIVWAARRDTHFLETIRGIKTIKLFNGQHERRSHWLNLLVETTNRQLTAQKLDLLFRTANGLLLGLIGILVVWMGAQKVLESVFSVGMLVAFLSYKDQFLRRVSELVNRLVDLRMLRLHAERLADIALTTPEPHDWSGDAPAEPRPVSIEVRNLSFRYGTSDAWVLDKISFHIEAGESVAIAGGSGCGKTTLLKLLAGLLEPTEGDIYIDGEPLSRVGTERFRSMIGVVMQDDQLFAGSIADNISFFSAYPDQERVLRCARMAAVHDDIAAMPMGYATLIGDMGTVLSGGQKQRVLIARALYREPSILFLDEATSHLDVAREKAVNDAIRTTCMTRVIIAHRPETIRASNRVILLDRGRIVPDEGVGSKTLISTAEPA
jgi:ATP-binding cassette subfamily B protein RaxB